MSAWLYPISKRARLKFQLKDGSQIPVSAQSFMDLVQSGKLVEDHWWHVHQNYDRIQRGDVVYIYTGDQDIGIIGYSKVQGKRKERRKEINLQFDLDKSRKLIDQPVPARVVRQWIRFPRASVYGLQQFQREVERHLPWSSSFYSKANELSFKNLNLRPASQTKISPRQHSRRLIHDTLLKPMRHFLGARGFKVGTRNFGRLQADLVGVRKNYVIIVEGKTNKRGAGRLEAREAFGQLHEYLWYFTKSSKRKFQYSLCVVFENRPERRVIDFLGDHDFLVTWVQDKRIRLASRLDKKFEKLRI